MDRIKETLKEGGERKGEEERKKVALKKKEGYKNRRNVKSSSVDGSSLMYPLYTLTKTRTLTHARYGRI